MLRVRSCDSVAVDVVFIVCRGKRVMAEPRCTGGCFESQAVSSTERAKNPAGEPK